MTTPELLEYIRKRMEVGATKESIVTALLKAGWRRVDVDQGFRKAQTQPETGPSTVRSESGTENYAGFWLRLAAYVTDELLIMAFLTVVVIVLMNVAAGLMGPAMAAAATLAGAIPTLLILIYFTIMEGSSMQATVGKKLIGIRVIADGGDRLSFFSAFLRNIGKIVSAIPLLIGFLMAAFSQKKQALHDKIAGSLVVKTGGAHVLRAILVPVLGLIVLGGGLGGYVKFVQFPAWKRGFMQSVSSLSQPMEQNSPKGRLPERIVEKEDQPVSLTEAEYDEILSSGAMDFENGVKTSLGPVAFKLSNFWDHNKQEPSVWVELRCVPIPNLHLKSKLARVIIHRVWDAQNRDIYNPESQFETEFFQSISFSERDTPIPHLSAIRNVHLVQGVVEENIRGVEGEMIIKLPVEIEVFSLRKGDLNAEIEGEKSGAKVLLTEVNQSDVALKYFGSGENYVSTLAFNEAGQQLERQGYSWFEDKDSVWNFKYNFKGIPETVKVIVASETVERRYPFVLEK